MDFSKINLFKVMRVKMEYLAERQDILSQTVANADTPGYKPKDLKPLDFERLTQQFSNKLNLRVTDATHINSRNFNSTQFKSTEEKSVFEINPTKNKVSLEEQMMKVNENAFDYTTTTSIYNKTAGLFKTAMGSGGSA
jgi:flagellar basal-body rod protein FlgB